MAKNETIEKTNFSEIQKQLETSIKKFQEANNLILNRNAFLNSKNKLLAFEKELKKKEETDFEVQDCKLKLISGKYSGEEIISIGNKTILQDFVSFITKKIDDKISEIELKIVA
jgi:hypothetical protein